MKFAREAYGAGLILEMLPLWKDHYDEICHYKDIPLDPDLSAYEQCDQKGLLRIYTARDGINLIGYQVFFIRSHPHYKCSIQASQDILFIASGYRRGMFGYRFIRWCDEQLRMEKVQVVCQHLKVKHDFSPVLERLGYEKQDILMTRRLDKWV